MKETWLSMFPVQARGSGAPAGGRRLSRGASRNYMKVRQEATMSKGLCLGTLSTREAYHRMSQEVCTKIGDAFHL